MARTSLTLPSQTGEDGKYLKTDGANASWEAIDSGTIDSIVAGTGISVDNTDPANPVVASTITQATRDSLGLDTDDTVTFANLSGTNTGDEVVATGAEVDTGTDNEKMVTPKAMEDSSYAKTSAIPVKATGAEIDTGTDDDKFATAKALKDSHNVPSVAPGTSGNVLTSNGTDWTSAAPVITATSTTTLTNKRITPRVSTETSSATPTINTDNVDCHTITALAADITSMTTNLSGTPTNFQKLIIRIKDNGTARTIAWGASFEAKGVALPTTTVISKVLTVGFIYDTVTSKWGCVAVAQTE